MAQRKDDRRELTTEEHKRLASYPLAIYLRLLKAVEERGGSPEDLLKILDPDPQYANVCVAPLVSRCLETTPKRKTVKIPNKSANQLIKWIQTECANQGISSDFLNWDRKKWLRLLHKARGKEFEVITHAFGRDWDRNDARHIHEDHQCDGNPVAFVFWVLTEKRVGWFTTIPNDDAKLFRSGDDLCASFFFRGEQYREFRLCVVDGEWNGGGALVGFRAI